MLRLQQDTSRHHATHLLMSGAVVCEGGLKFRRSHSDKLGESIGLGFRILELRAVSYSSGFAWGISLGFSLGHMLALF